MTATAESMKPRIAVLTALLVACTAAATRAQESADPALFAWRQKVTAAKALDDETVKRDTLLALVREALRTREVRLSGNAHNDQVHPDDNQPAPVVNFDARLNQKSSVKFRPSTVTRPLQNNFGYYFTSDGAGYVVIGPAALDPRSPVFTRMAAEHELFHANTHVGDPRPLEDRELETWTQMFVTFFHEVHRFNQRWAPMLAYYDEADPGERKAAIDRLAAYYRAPPSAAGDDAARLEIRTAFEEWLARRKKDSSASGARLITDVEKAIAQPSPSK